VPRYRQPLLAIVLSAAVCVTACGLGATAAFGQAAAPLDAALLRPTFDGDLRDPPRFRGRGKAGDVDPASGNRRGLGGGTTGFDSTGARKRKPKATQRSKSAANAGAPSGGTPVGADAGAKTDPAPASDSPPPLPKQLQPAGTPLTGRIYNPTRPGAPPLSPDGATATVATTPPSLRQPPDLRPFDPLGIQVGAFNFRPAFEYGRGYDTNVPRNSGPPAASSWFNLYAAELLVGSNWARHELTATLRGSYFTYDTNHTYDRPNLDSRLDLRIDATRDTRIELEGRYLLYTDYPGNPNIPAGIARLPLAQTYGATAGIGQHFNRLDVSLRGTFDRTVYDDSEFVDGETASNAGRNFNRYGAQLRTTYEVTPGVRPFVEAGGDTRKYDLPIDAAGVNRSSQGAYGKAGTTFELRPTLTGEVSFGYLQRVYQDPSLENIRGPTVDATLIWLASALTSVKLIAITAVTESTLVGVSGAFSRDVAVQVDHAFRRWLVGTLRFGRGTDEYVGSPRVDTRYVASSALAYNLTRELVLRGEYRQEWRYSNIPGNNYWAHVWLLGVRLQR
jgi:hypothetical protein